ncbi:O-fucosyltransferase family protein [Bacteroides sp. 519]|uniref:O-fucosyltransferase family protein n=1 Tax=Bacteroides sp. 519 TaxID=2302937 RepID=UPI0013D14A54|nr:hypothetical protein [Bacteroides sp. 519]
MKKLIYNLGRRGFFSEINNLVIAKIFAEDNKWSFEVNSFYWNCKYRYGLRDYFDINIKENNNLFSAQLVRTNKKSRVLITNLHSVFYATTQNLNCLYKLFHHNIVWGNYIYETFRSQPNLANIDKDRFLNNLKQLLQLKHSLNESFLKKTLEMELPNRFLGIHIRRGDKITTGEMEELPLSIYLTAIKETSFKYIYIATDDYRSIEYIKSELSPLGYQIYHNPELKADGFSEGKFNHYTKNNRYNETLSLLFDIFILFKASYFIGTFSSNLSRVIPCVLGLENCKSLDIDWFVG